MLYIYIHIHIPYCIPIVGDRYIQSILASFDFDDVVVHVLEIPTICTAGISISTGSHISFPHLHLC